MLNLLRIKVFNSKQHQLRKNCIGRTYERSQKSTNYIQHEEDETSMNFHYISLLRLTLKLVCVYWTVNQKKWICKSMYLIWLWEFFFLLILEVVFIVAQTKSFSLLSFDPVDRLCANSLLINMYVAEKGFDFNLRIFFFTFSLFI